MALFVLLLWCYALLLCCEAVPVTLVSGRSTLLIARKSQISCTSPCNQPQIISKEHLTPLVIFRISISFKHNIYSKLRFRGASYMYNLLINYLSDHQQKVLSNEKLSDWLGNRKDLFRSFAVCFVY